MTLLKLLNGRLIMDWIIPANLKNYDVFGEIKRFGVIEWRQGKFNIEKDDTVYIYISKPEGYIAFKCNVEEVNISRLSLQIDDSGYFLNNKLQAVNRYMRLKPIKQYSPTDITFEKLESVGFPRIQSARKATPVFYKLLESIDK